MTDLFQNFCQPNSHCNECKKSNSGANNHYLTENYHHHEGVNYKKLNPVPKFTIYSSKRNTSDDRNKITSEVIDFRCGVEEKEWPSHLLTIFVYGKNRVVGSKRVIFVTHGLPNKQQYAHHLIPQNNFVHNYALIHIVGLSPEVALVLVPMGQE